MIDFKLIDGLAAGACVVRAITITTGFDLDEVWEAVEKSCGDKDWDGEHPDGSVNHDTVEELLGDFGFEGVWGEISWDALPCDKAIIVDLEGHVAAVVNGVLIDTFDCRDRPIEGYWVLQDEDEFEGE